MVRAKKGYVLGKLIFNSNDSKTLLPTMRTYGRIPIHSAMQREKISVSNIVSKIGALALGLTLVLSGCGNEQGESHKAIGTGDGDALEESGYEVNNGEDSLNSGAAVNSATRADTAAEPYSDVEQNVSQRVDTSESYSSVNGRSSTSNVGTSVSVNENRAVNRVNDPRPVNQTPTQGDSVTTTNRDVPLKQGLDGKGGDGNASGNAKTNEAGETNPNGQGGANRVERPVTGQKDPNGRPLDQNGQAKSANESGNKQNVSSDKTQPKKSAQ